MLRFQVGAAYLWRDGEELTLIDTGTADCAQELGRALDEAARAQGQVKAELKRIVLTHWHEDHAGSANELAIRHHVPVFAHRHDAPVIRGEKRGAPPVLEAFERPIRKSLPPIPPAPPCRAVQELENGDVLDFGGGARVIAVPGHTDGSIALYLPGPKVLFTGDAVANVSHVMLGVFNTDRAQAVASMAKLAELAELEGVETALFGHGDPIVQGASAALRRAA